MPLILIASNAHTLFRVSKLWCNIIISEILQKIFRAVRNIQQSLGGSILINIVDDISESIS